MICMVNNTCSCQSRACVITRPVVGCIILDSVAARAICMYRDASVTNLKWSWDDTETSIVGMYQVYNK